MSTASTSSYLPEVLQLAQQQGRIEDIEIRAYIEPTVDATLEVSSPGALFHTLRLVNDVLASERIVHFDCLARRVARSIGLQKSAAKVRKLLHLALQIHVKNGEVFFDEEDRQIFACDHVREIKPVLWRTDVKKTSLDEMPMEQLSSAMFFAATLRGSGTFDELQRDVIELYKIKSLGGNIRDRLRSVRENLKSEVVDFHSEQDHFFVGAARFTLVTTDSIEAPYVAASH